MVFTGKTCCSNPHVRMSSYCDGNRQQFILTNSNQHTVCCVCPCHNRKGSSLGKPSSHCYKKNKNNEDNERKETGTYPGCTPPVDFDYKNV